MAYTAALVVALAGVMATLALPQRIDGGTAHYGKPLWFAESDMSIWTRTDRGGRWRLNPWENPTTFDAGRFFLSFCVFALPLVGGVWLVARRARG